MSDIYFASLDIGTSGVKVLVINQSGKIISKSYRVYPCEYPKPGWFEQDVITMWKMICEATKEAIYKFNIPAKNIKSLGISSQRGTFIPVDRDLKPLMNSIVWADARADRELDLILEDISKERYHEITGVYPSTIWAYPKMKWFIDNKKELFEKTFKILNGQEYFLSKLGAEELSTDPSSLTMNGMLEIDKLDWSKELCDIIGLPMDKLPAVGTPARMVGKISKQASNETGFYEGMPIAIGGGDQQCTAIGAGVVREGMAVVILGTGGAVVAHIDSRKKDENQKVVIGGSCIPGKWDMEGLQATGSSALTWWQQNFAADENNAADALGLNVFEIISLEASKSPPCSNGLIFFPFFQGQTTPNYDYSARGGFLGISFIHDKKDMMRAIMEGTVFELNMIKIAMEDVLQKEFCSLRVSGGGAKSNLWNQIQADIYGKPVERLEVPECASVGAAILGAYGCNYFSSIEEGADQMVNVAQTIEPIESNHKLYRKAYNIFEQAFTVLSKNNINKEIAEFQKIF